MDRNLNPVLRGKRVILSNDLWRKDRLILRAGTEAIVHDKSAHNDAYTLIVDGRKVNRVPGAIIVVPIVPVDGGQE